MFSKRILTTAVVMAPIGCAVDATWDDAEVRSVEQRASTRTFGIHSTDSYENSWLVPVSASPVIARLSAELDDEATRSFWFNLVGKKYYWETGGDQASNSLEDVDMFITATHGLAEPTRATWAMWDSQSFAYSSSMALGNEGRGLSIFTQFSCETLAFDGQTWTRWDSIMKGGLRAALGSHDLFFMARATTVGQDFAQYLNSGYTLKYAWSSAWNASAANDQDPAVLFSGNSSSDCAERREYMSWDNFDGYPRRSGSSASHWCGSYWDNI